MKSLIEVSVSIAGPDTLSALCSSSEVAQPKYLPFLFCPTLEDCRFFHKSDQFSSHEDYVEKCVEVGKLARADGQNVDIRVIRKSACLSWAKAMGLEPGPLSIVEYLLRAPYLRDPAMRLRLGFPSTVEVDPAVKSWTDMLHLEDKALLLSAKSLKDIEDKDKELEKRMEDAINEVASRDYLALYRIMVRLALHATGLGQAPIVMLLAYLLYREMCEGDPMVAMASRQLANRYGFYQCPDVMPDSQLEMLKIVGQLAEAKRD